VKNITVAGRLGKDSVIRRTNGGDPILAFSVAVDDGYGQNKRTLWFDCSLWGKRGEALETFLKKGTAVAVSGDLSTREHEGKTYLTVRVSEVTLQGQKQEQGSAPAKSAAAPMASLIDDDVPFAPEMR